jgi:hypothetical protein
VSAEGAISPTEKNDPGERDHETLDVKSANGADGWSSWDGFHLKLPSSETSPSDKQAQACLDEYAGLTREEGKSKNDKFEKDYEKLLKPFFEKYGKKK